MPVFIVSGDITKASEEVIVNAANPKMLGGGGVDGAIHKAAGPKLVEECRKVRPENGIRCPFGEARITGAGDLLSRYVIHAVGPIYRRETNPDETLAKVYNSIFELAIEYGCKSLAIPAISCGAYGFPIDRAATIAIDSSLKFSDLTVVFYLFDQSVEQAWKAELNSRI